MLENLHHYSHELFERYQFVSVSIDFPHYLFPNSCLLHLLAIKDRLELVLGDHATVVLVDQFECCHQVVLVYHLVFVYRRRNELRVVDNAISVNIEALNELVQIQIQVPKRFYFFDSIFYLILL